MTRHQIGGDFQSDKAVTRVVLSIQSEGKQVFSQMTLHCTSLPQNGKLSTNHPKHFLIKFDLLGPENTCSARSATPCNPPPPRPTPTLQGPGHPDLPNLPRNPIAISSQPFIPKRTCPCEVASRAADAADPCSPLPSGYGHGAGGTPDNNKNATHKKRVVT